MRDHATTTRILPLLLILVAAPLAACAEADKPDSGDDAAADSGATTGFGGADTAEGKTDPSEDCRDALDNDGDGWADDEDPDCPDGEAGGYGSTACNDGVDNDGDGYVDADDRDCDSAMDDSEG